PRPLLDAHADIPRALPSLATRELRTLPVLDYASAPRVARLWQRVGPTRCPSLAARPGCASVSARRAPGVCDGFCPMRAPAAHQFLPVARLERTTVSSFPRALQSHAQLIPRPRPLPPPPWERVGEGVRGWRMCLSSSSCRHASSLTATSAAAGRGGSPCLAPPTSSPHLSLSPPPHMPSPTSAALCLGCTPSGGVDCTGYCYE
ncbi:unnamed protein product, partial [Closterium sp. NIES-53]